MLKKFLSDKRGNLAITSAIALLPMIAAVAAAVDYSQISRHSANLQQALDAAALATGKKLGNFQTNEELEAYSEKFFYANVGNLDKSAITFSYGGENEADGNTILLQATYDYPLLFGGVLNRTTYTLDIESTVKAGNDTLEIALVLDNSGSMSGSKISTAKTAATSLVNQIHAAMAGSNYAEPVKFTLVPFAGHVNVGSNKSDEDWIDSTGAAPHHNENLDWSEYPGAIDQGDGRWKDASGNWLTRFTLFDDMNNVSWKGCVESRPYPYMVNDAEPSIDVPETLYVPVFAPDEPDDYSGEHEQIEVEEEATEGEFYCLYQKNGICRYWQDWYSSNNYSDGTEPNLEMDNYTYWGYGWYERIVDNGVPAGGFDDATTVGGGGTTVVEGDQITEEEFYNDYLPDWTSSNAPAGKLQYDPAHTGTGADQYKRLKWTFKYLDQSSNTSSTWRGPNAGCTTTAITPLTSSSSAVINAIDDMGADGSTNIPLGISWGWRALSKGAPFEEGRATATPDNSKIMIVMTDGNNTYYTPESLGAEADITKSTYGSYGYTGSTTYDPKGRLFEAYDAENNPDHDRDTFQAAMDENMLEVCTNAKNEGVKIYSVAFEVPDNSSVKEMLENCSSTNPKTGEKQYFDASDETELLAAFSTIGTDISNLRLSK